MRANHLDMGFSSRIHEGLTRFRLCVASAPARLRCASENPTNWPQCTEPLQSVSRRGAALIGDMGKLVRLAVNAARIGVTTHI